MQRAKVTANTYTKTQYSSLKLFGNQETRVYQNLARRITEHETERNSENLNESQGFGVRELPG
jgi:hypothetical protein